MIKLLNNDCIFEMNKLLEQNLKVDCIITDPPYNISQKNNFHTMVGRKGIDFGEWDKDFDLFSWIDLAKNLLDKNGSMFIFNSWKNLGSIALYAETLGMVTKDCFRWEKTNPMPRNRDRRYVTDYEMGVWLVVKDSKWVFNRQNDSYERPKFVSSLTPKNEKTTHPTQKPLCLMEHIIKIHTNKNQIVLDPFMGSGTTGVACKKLDRSFIGIELDKTYYDIAVNRISNFKKKEIS